MIVNNVSGFLYPKRKSFGQSYWDPRVTEEVLIDKLSQHTPLAGFKISPEIVARKLIIGLRELFDKFRDSSDYDLSILPFSSSRRRKPVFGEPQCTILLVDRRINEQKILRINEFMPERGSSSNIVEDEGVLSDVSRALPISIKKKPIKKPPNSRTVLLFEGTP